MIVIHNIFFLLFPLALDPTDFLQIQFPKPHASNASTNRTIPHLFWTRTHLDKFTFQTFNIGRRSEGSYIGEHYNYTMKLRHPFAAAADTGYIYPRKLGSSLIPRTPSSDWHGSGQLIKPC
jgi:hypothetical protein